MLESTMGASETSILSSLKMTAEKYAKKSRQFGHDVYLQTMIAVV